jgi:hypothetical protein
MYVGSYQVNDASLAEIAKLALYVASFGRIYTQ